MARQSDHFQIGDLEVISYLYAIRKWSLTKISQHMDYSIAKVSRLLAEAKSQGEQYIVERVDLGKPLKSRIKEIEAAIERRDCRETLFDKLNSITPRYSLQLFDSNALEEERHTFKLQSLYVFDSSAGAAQEDNAKWDRSLLDFGETIADTVLSLLRGCHRIGISWGRHMCSVVRGLKQLERPIRTLESIEVPCVFPLWGEMLGMESLDDEQDSPFAVERLSSSSLAMELGRILYGSTKYSLSITGTPAVISKRNDRSDYPILHDYFHNAPSYQKIFGKLIHDTKHSRKQSSDSERGLLRIGKYNLDDRQSLVRTADAMLLPSGTPSHHGRFLQTGLLDSLGISDEDSSRLFFGDIGSCLVLRDICFSRQDWKQLLEVRMRWLGMRYYQLEHFARVADATGKRGTIVVSVGPLRARVLIEGVRYGLINNLIIDRSLADAMLTLLHDERIGRADNYPKSHKYSEKVRRMLVI